MRDLVAIIIVLILVVVALAMATSLQWYRRGHERLRQALKTQGQTILAEVPVDDGLAFFSEDTQAFYWAGHRIPKHEIRAAHVLISGAPLSSIRSDRFPGVAAAGPTAALEPGTVERERWDVGIELENRRGDRTGEPNDSCRVRLDSPAGLSGNGSENLRISKAGDRGTRPGESPLAFLNPSAMIDCAGQHKKQIREAIHIAQDH